MNKNEERKMVLELMGTANAAVLTTIDRAGFPQTRAMFNLRNGEMFPEIAPLFEEHDYDLMIIFTTNTSSAKVGDIRENPAVSVYYYIQDEWRGVMLGGSIEIVDDIELKRALWQEGWERYYPKGYNDPDHTVLRLLPSTVRGWNQSHTFNFEIG